MRQTMNIKGLLIAGGIAVAAISGMLMIALLCLVASSFSSPASYGVYPIGTHGQTAAPIEYLPFPGEYGGDDGGSPTGPWLNGMEWQGESRIGLTGGTMDPTGQGNVFSVDGEVLNLPN